MLVGLVEGVLHMTDRGNDDGCGGRGNRSRCQANSALVCLARQIACRVPWCRGRQVLGSGTGCGAEPMHGSAAVRCSTPTQVHGPAQAQLMGCSANRAGAGWGHDPSSGRWVEVVAKKAFSTLSVRAFSADVGAESVAWERPRLVGRSRGSLARSVNEVHKGRFRMPSWC